MYLNSQQLALGWPLRLPYDTSVQCPHYTRRFHIRIMWYHYYSRKFTCVDKKVGKSHQHNVLHRCLDCLGPGYKGKRECVRRMKMPIFRNTSNPVLCNYRLEDLNSKVNLLLRISEKSCQNTERHNTQENQIAECLQLRSLCLTSCRCGHFSINSEM